MLSRVNMASASARWLASICPLRHGKGSGELSDYPLADREAAGLLLAKPSLHAPGLSLISEGCDEQRCIQVKRQ